MMYIADNNHSFTEWRSGISSAFNNNFRVSNVSYLSRRSSFNFGVTQFPCLCSCPQEADTGAVLAPHVHIATADA